MKRITTIIVFLLVVVAANAQHPRGQKAKPAQRKFQILIKNEENPRVIQNSNDRFVTLQGSTQRDAERGILGDLLWTGYTSAITQKTVNASSNLLSYGISYIKEAIKGNREKWYRTAQQQCRYNQLLSSETQINDFYALPSTKGAMDPSNLKFEGFGCKNYIERTDSAGQGVSVFYVFCRMRRDDEGIRHIVNHSRFLVEIDTLYIRPEYCNLPNDSTGSVESRFNFDKRDNLNLQLKVRLYSSWMNQATMISDNQQLGEFTIHVKVDKNKLNEKGEFIYNPQDPSFKELVSVEGDSFIVPRSYTGTSNARDYQPSWGTGQYRVEMEVLETCEIVDSYYQIREAGNGEAVFLTDDVSGNVQKRWDKAKWKTEWKTMKKLSKQKSFLQNAWNCIVESYKGSGWVATLTDPFATALYSYETTKLTNAFNDLHVEIFSTPAPPASTTSSKNPNNVSDTKKTTGN